MGVAPEVVGGAGEMRQRRAQLGAWLRRARWATVARERGLRVPEADVDRQALVLLARYGLARPMTRDHIATTLQVRRRRVWQVEQHALRVLRAHPHEWTGSVAWGDVQAWPGLLRAVFDVRPGAATGTVDWCCPVARALVEMARLAVNNDGLGGVYRGG